MRQKLSADINQRTITGFFIVLVIVVSVVTGPLTFVIVCGVINLLALIEFYRLMRLQPGSRRVIGLILSVTLFISSYLLAGNLVDWQVALINLPIAAAIFLAELYRKSENPFQDIAVIFLGIAYITMPFIFFISAAFLPFEEGDYQMEIILGYFIVLWASDTGAYLVGSLLGSHPLFERVSPRKTWEGSLGGALCAISVAVSLSFFFTDLNLVSWVALAMIIVVFRTFGDLIKSMLKRSLSVKDSGTSLPGHGGFIDRFDSLMGSAPFAFCYLAVIWK